jgi:H+/Cl- antiporter ClcA
VTRHHLEYGCAVVVIGVLAGFAGMATTVVLHAIEHVAFHYSFGSLLDGVSDSSLLRRALAPTIGGALAGAGWWLLRRRTAVPGLSDLIRGHRPIPRMTLALDAGLQVLVVGSGASLGREGAPRQLSAAMGDAGTSRWTLTARDREILLACAAGAGLGAVYSVPLGGALFAAQIMLHSWHPRVLGTALITSSLAVAVAAPVTHDDTPLSWPDPSLSSLLLVVAVLLTPLTVGIGASFTALMHRATPVHISTTWRVIPAIAGAGLLIGIASHYWPELPGNGKSILTVTLNSDMTLAGAAAILMLKPLLTAAYLRAGAVGGLLTPALATGAALGSLVAIAANSVLGWSVSVAAVSLICAAGVLAITQQAPLWSALFVWELARPPWWLLAVFVVAAGSAHGLHRILGTWRTQRKRSLLDTQE